MQKTIEEYFDRLWPLNRSLTGNGNRQTLAILRELIDLELIEYPSGKQVLDWTVPEEWNVNEAWIRDMDGNTVVDFARNNLHLLGYSIPFEGVLSKAELAPYIHTLPELPDLIPYLSSYYTRTWGFCMSQKQWDALPEAKYQVRIDSSLDTAGSLSTGEAFIRGESEEEILISSYICHPSLAHNELSGPLLSAFLWQRLRKWPRHRKSYRLVLHPETIGAICLLDRLGEYFNQQLRGGLVLSCLGDAAPFHYKETVFGDTLADRAVKAVLRHADADHVVFPYKPAGSDERQYGSPGFRLPVGTIMRTPYERYPEYHTSGDSKELIDFNAMMESVLVIEQILAVMDRNETYLNLYPEAEPQLGKRNLYPSLLSRDKLGDAQMAIMWTLNLSDGNHDLIDIIDRSGLNPEIIIDTADRLLKAGMIRELSAEG